MDELGFAWEEGRWHGSGTDAGSAAAAVERHGFYFAQWQLKGDEWLIKSELYSSSPGAQDRAAGRQPQAAPVPPVRLPGGRSYGKGSMGAESPE